MKKIYHYFILALMILTTETLWGQEIKEKDITYSINDNNEAVITHGDKNLGDTVSIPETVAYNGKNYPVTAIGDDAFRGCTKIKTVLFNKTIRSIGRSAFKGCTSLKNTGKPNIPKVFYTPAALEELGDSAFAESGLIALYCDDSKKLTYVPNGIIDHCPNIKEFNTPRFYDDDKFGDLGVIDTNNSSFVFSKTKRGLEMPPALAKLRVKNGIRVELYWYINDFYYDWRYEQADGTYVDAKYDDAKERTNEFYKDLIDHGFTFFGNWWPAFAPLGNDWDTSERFHIIPYNSTTGISDVTSSTNENNNSRYYDLQGRVVESPKAGQLYIHNGKKVIF
jgi:hypothetical protein